MSRSSAARRSWCNLFIIYFGLPSLGLQLDANGAALVAMTVNLGAYAAEIVRAGIGAVHPSQLEAAQALCMTRWQVMRHVVLLPALEKVYPALASQFTLMMLASSVVSAISAEELTAAPTCSTRKPSAASRSTSS